MMKSTKLLFAPALMALMALTGCKGAATEIKVTKMEKKALASEKIEFKNNKKYVINADCSEIETIDNDIAFFIIDEIGESFNCITSEVVNDDTIKMTTTKQLTKVAFSQTKTGPDKDEFGFDSDENVYLAGDGTLSTASPKLKIEFTAKKDISGYVAITLGA